MVNCCGNARPQPNDGTHPTADTRAFRFPQSLGAAADAWRSATSADRSEDGSRRALGSYFLMRDSILTILLVLLPAFYLFAFIMGVRWTAAVLAGCA